MAWVKKSKPGRPYDDPDYRRRRKILMGSVTPLTRCAAPGCGKLLSQHKAHRNGKPARWQCAHTKPGDNRAPLALWASVCNLAEGARRGHHTAWGRHRPGAAQQVESEYRLERFGFVDAHWPGHFEPEGDRGVPPCRARNGVNCPSCVEFWKANPTQVRR